MSHYLSAAECNYFVIVEFVAIFNALKWWITCLANSLYAGLIIQVLNIALFE